MVQSMLTTTGKTTTTTSRDAQSMMHRAALNSSPKDDTKVASSSQTNSVNGSTGPVDVMEIDSSDDENIVQQMVQRPRDDHAASPIAGPSVSTSPSASFASFADVANPSPSSSFDRRGSSGTQQTLGLSRPRRSHNKSRKALEAEEADEIAGIAAKKRRRSSVGPSEAMASSSVSASQVSPNGSTRCKTPQISPAMKGRKIVMGNGSEVNGVATVYDSATDQSSPLSSLRGISQSPDSDADSDEDSEREEAERSTSPLRPVPAANLYGKLKTSQRAAEAIATDPASSSENLLLQPNGQTLHRSSLSQVANATGAETDEDSISGSSELSDLDSDDSSLLQDEDAASPPHKRVRGRHSEATSSGPNGRRTIFSARKSLPARMQDQIAEAKAETTSAGRPRRSAGQPSFRPVLLATRNRQTPHSGPDSSASDSEMSSAEEESDGEGTEGDSTRKTKSRRRALSKPSWRKKVYLSTGLYAPGSSAAPLALNGDHVKGQSGPSSASLTTRKSVFPEPMYYGQDLLVTEKDFELPYPIYEEQDKLRARAEAKRKPTRYRHINKNRYTSRPKLRGEIPICQCKPGGDCGDDCLNRLLQFICEPKVCPCGDKCTNISLGARPHARCDVGWYGKRGFGLRTQDDVPKNGLVDEYRGEVINLAEATRRVNEYYKDEGNFYFLDYDAAAGEVLDGGRCGNITRFANHSCNPNCYIQKWIVCGTDEERTAEFQVGLFALRDIAAGEELTYDYGWSAFGTKQMAIEAAKKTTVLCHCGAPNCCGILGGKKIAPALSPAPSSLPAKKRKRIKANRSSAAAAIAAANGIRISSPLAVSSTASPSPSEDASTSRSSSRKKTSSKLDPVILSAASTNVPRAKETENDTSPKAKKAFALPSALSSADAARMMKAAMEGALMGPARTGAAASWFDSATDDDTDVESPPVAPREIVGKGKVTQPAESAESESDDQLEEDVEMDSESEYTGPIRPHSSGPRWTARGQLLLSNYPPNMRFFYADGKEIPRAQVEKTSLVRNIYSQAEMDAKKAKRRRRNAHLARVRRGKHREGDPVPVKGSKRKSKRTKREAKIEADVTQSPTITPADASPSRTSIRGRVSMAVPESPEIKKEAIASPLVGSPEDVAAVRRRRSFKVTVNGHASYSEGEASSSAAPPRRSIKPSSKVLANTTPASKRRGSRTRQGRPPKAASSSTGKVLTPRAAAMRATRAAKQTGYGPLPAGTPTGNTTKSTRKVVYTSPNDIPAGFTFLETNGFIPDLPSNLVDAGVLSKKDARRARNAFLARVRRFQQRGLSYESALMKASEMRSKGDDNTPLVKAKQAALAAASQSSSPNATPAEKAAKRTKLTATALGVPLAPQRGSVGTSSASVDSLMVQSAATTTTASEGSSLHTSPQSIASASKDVIMVDA